MLLPSSLSRSVLNKQVPVSARAQIHTESGKQFTDWITVLSQRILRDTNEQLGEEIYKAESDRVPSKGTSVLMECNTYHSPSTWIHSGSSTWSSPNLILLDFLVKSTLPRHDWFHHLPLEWLIQILPLPSPEIVREWWKFQNLITWLVPLENPQGLSKSNPLTWLISLK